MTNLVDRCRHFTASIDLTLLTTDWDVLHKGKGDEGKLQRRMGERGVYYGWVLWAVDTGQSCDYDSVTSEFPWWRAGRRESHSPTVSPM